MRARGRRSARLTDACRRRRDRHRVGGSCARLQSTAGPVLGRALLLARGEPEQPGRAVRLHAMTGPLGHLRGGNAAVRPGGQAGAACAAALVAACGGPGGRGPGAPCGCGTSAGRGLADVVLGALLAHTCSEWVKESSRWWPARKYPVVGRARLYGMSSRAVCEEDQWSISSLMSSGRRSGPRARRTWIRHVPESRSASIGPRKRPWRTCSSVPCRLRCQLSRAARQASKGMSASRRNDSHPTAEHMSALGLPLPQFADEGAAGCQGFWASPAGTLSQRRMR